MRLRGKTEIYLGNGRGMIYNLGLGFMTQIPDLDRLNPAA